MKLVKNFYDVFLRGKGNRFFIVIFTLLILSSFPLLAQLTVTATATPTSGTAPLNVTFTATVTGGTSPYTFDWDFGDGSAHGTANPAQHTYNLAGKYTVKLIVTDSSATPLSTTITVGTITVYVAVTIGASPQCGNPPLNVCFQGGASNGTEPYTYKWNFGDGAPAYNTTEQNPCHGYMNVGIYTATLTVTDAKGNTGNTTQKIVVYVEPLFTVTATADVSTGLAPLRVNFFASHSSSSYITGDYSYDWDFGDGSTHCTDLAPQHIYDTPGTYTVTLTVTAKDICGKSVSYTDTVDIQVLEDPSIFITKPSTGTQFSGGQLILESIAYTSGSVIRVDYYIDDSYIGSATSAPYRLILDACGANGTYSIYAMLYDSKGHTAQSPTVTVTITNPTLDGTHFTLQNPFRIKFFGSGFKAGAKLYFNGYEVPKTKVVSSNIVIAKGGDPLKALAPRGVPVMVTIVNKDGSCSSPVTFQR
jgi:PKD repeat protein